MRESSQGTDLNGDGDLFDRVPHLLDLRTGVLTNIALAIGGITMDGSLLFFEVSEPGNGRTDLNGDGDALDFVLHLYDANTPALINLRIETSGRSQAQHLLAFTRPEFDEDLNGDGDMFDSVVHVLGQSCQTGTAGSAAGPVANVLSVNGQTNTAFVPIGDSIQVAFGASPLGPAPASYVLWVWASSPVNPTTLRAQGRILGCTQNPTPLIPSLFPQPFRCIRSPSLPAILCAGVVQIAGAPAGAPWAMERPGGFMQRGEFLLQGLVEDKGASNLIGYSVTNAVTLVVH